MTELTARFALPLLQPGQAQKELYHNEALTLIDAALHCVVESVGLSDPPIDAMPGLCWVVSAVPTGDWTGRRDAIACATSAGWRFVAPQAGTRVWDRASAAFAYYNGAIWRPAEEIAEIGGGSVIDAEVRAALAALVAALAAQGIVRA